MQPQFFGRIERGVVHSPCYWSERCYGQNDLECQDGAVAQLGERSVRNAEVEGSTPFRSIISIGFAAR